MQGDPAEVGAIGGGADAFLVGHFRHHMGVRVTIFITCGHVLIGVWG